MTDCPKGAVPRPTAGALRLVEPSTADPQTIDVARYLEEMSAHCPYLSPSAERRLTTWSVYQATGDRNAVEEGLFHACVDAAERLRSLMRRPHGLLRCENVVLLGEVPGVSHRDLLMWPHWALTNLYSSVGIMFGKFCAGIEERTRSGARTPASPVSFLPVRAAIRRRDPFFLHADPDLAAALATADDEGRDVFASLSPSRDWTEIRTWARHLLPPTRPLPPSGTP